MVGNPHTEYERAMLSQRSEKFNPMPLQSGGLKDETFEFNPAVVLFEELDAKITAVIRGR